MPNTDFSNITAAGYGDEPNGNEYETLPAGGYVIEVLGTYSERAKRRITFLVDIAEGPYAGFYRDDQFYEDKPYAHQCYMYLTTRALPFTKRTLEAFTASNSGFNAYDAYLNDDWDAFTGKRVGVLLGLEEARRKSDDTIYIRPDWFHADLTPVSMIESGNYSEKPLRKLERPNAPIVQNEALAQGRRDPGGQPPQGMPQFV